MFFHQRFIPGLAIYSYIVGNEKTKEATVIDPTRDVDEYIEMARREGLQIKHILETHVHADFVSGARELKDRLDGVPVIHSSGMGGADWTPTYADHVIQDNDDIVMGDIRLRAFHTPGHTLEHVSWLLFDDARSRETPWLVFTGDFLFVGDVGRPDLLGEEAQKELARQLYGSVFEKLPVLPDYTEFYPGHGAGSLCGKALGSRGASTVGYERQFNAALVEKEESEWIANLLSGMPQAPPYFARMKKINVTGPKVLGRAPIGRQPILAAQVRDGACDECLILDVRSKEAFASAHIPGAVNIPFEPSFSTWAGWVLPFDQPLLLVTENADQVAGVVTHLIRVGLDDIRGYLEGSMGGWMTSGYPVESINMISVQDLHESIDEEQTVLDVRTENEWNAGHIEGAMHIHGGLLLDRVSEISRECPVTVICGSGYRGSIAASFLKREGFKDVQNVTGGMSAWKNASLPMTAEAGAKGRVACALRA